MQAPWEQSLLAINDDAVGRNRGACIAGKPCSHKAPTESKSRQKKAPHRRGFLVFASISCLSQACR
ncbi:hypothetical protein FGE05_21070 [Pseudomonas sp. ICMP22404]|nr:hypothetical protein FGE05_21070 [Pseudomonas sp. ICMP22404]